MYLLEQIKLQFTACIVNYEVNPAEVGGSLETANPSETPETPATPSEVSDKAGVVCSKLDDACDKEKARGLIDEGDSSKVKGGDLVGDRGEDILDEKAEMTFSEKFDTLSSKPPFDQMNPGEIEQYMAHIEVPEGMTHEEAVTEAMKGRIEETQDSSIAKLGESIGEDLMVELTEKFGEDGKERLAAVSDIYQRLIEEGADVPENLEAFEKMIEEEIARIETEKLEAENPGESVASAVVGDAAKSVYSGGSANHLRGYNNNGSFGLGGQPRMTPGEAVANNAQLDEAISKAPTEKAKQLLLTAQKYLGMNETTHRNELRQFLGFDPKATPWCKGFTNKCAEASGISLNSSGSLFSLTGVNDGRKLSKNEEPLPGDCVMVKRNGGGHIGFFLGMSPNGCPIIIGGNQGGKREGGGGVTITEEKRQLVGINRIGGDKVA